MQSAPSSSSAQPRQGAWCRIALLVLVTLVGHDAFMAGNAHANGEIEPVHFHAGPPHEILEPLDGSAGPRESGLGEDGCGIAWEAVLQGSGTAISIQIDLTGQEPFIKSESTAHRMVKSIDCTGPPVDLKILFQEFRI